MPKRPDLVACLKLMRESDDLDGIRRLLSRLPEADIGELASTVLRESEARLAFGRATPSEIRAERMAEDMRTPEDWRRWLKNSRAIFNGDPDRIAQQYAFISDKGKTTVFFAMTPTERDALAKHQQERKRQINLALAKSGHSLPES